MSGPSVELRPLERPDGSASYSFNGYSVLAAVNGPVEVQRRDELPDEAAIDISVRPATGVGAIRERYLELIVHEVLHKTILTKAHPRSLIQVTLQVLSTPGGRSEATKTSTSSLGLSILPSLLNAALLALLTTSLPLQTTYAATGLVVDPDGNLQLEPSPKQMVRSRSVHVACFSIDGDLMLFLSEGPVAPENLSLIEQHARMACLGGQNQKSGSTNDMDVDAADAGHSALLKHSVLEGLKKHDAWRKRD